MIQAPIDTKARQTKYCIALIDCMDKLGHATNAELLLELRDEFPGLSATTVHRATSRLHARGRLSVAPPANDGSMRYDANTSTHDHFQCTSCDLLKDTQIKDSVIPILESSIHGCKISGPIVVSGVCKSCSTNQVRR